MFVVHKKGDLLGVCHAGLLYVAIIPVVVNGDPKEVDIVRLLCVLSLGCVPPVRLGQEVFDSSGHVVDAVLDLAGAVL